MSAIDERRKEHTGCDDVAEMRRRVKALRRTEERSSLESVGSRLGNGIANRFVYYSRMILPWWQEKEHHIGTNY